jgi:hypothetical protein
MALQACHHGREPGLGQVSGAAEFELSDRGFKHYDPVITQYGHEVRVYESSVATEPCIWLAINLTAEMSQAARSNIAPCEAHAHMTLEQAKAVKERLESAIANHYQFTDEDPPTFEFSYREKMLGTYLLQRGALPAWATPMEAEAYSLKVQAYTRGTGS